ncbi:SGNH/GDSL hydrolase family protein [Collinsella intestinalis]|nr:SGNH/GDSL hydrolase family protein [Collinsella intestinalis]
MSPDHMSTEESDVSKTAECAEAASSAKEVGSVNCANEAGGNTPRSISGRLKGRGFSVLGDSISTLMGWVPEGWRVHYEGEVHVDGVERPQDTWWGRVIDHFDGHLIANSSFSGSVVEGYGFPAGNSEKRIASLLGARGECPDVVLVYMGINDYGWGGGRNQVMGGSLSASARPEDLAGERSVEWVVGPDALDRFDAAYRDVLAAIRRLAPSSEIWCLTLCPATSPSEAERCYKYQIRGIELDAYNRAIVRAAREAGAHVADVRAYGIQYDAVDGCHPSALGMRQIADMVIARMEGSSEMPASIGDAPRAVRTCGRSHCHGCPMDESTDSRWAIACRGPKDGR